MEVQMMIGTTSLPRPRSAPAAGPLKNRVSREFKSPPGLQPHNSPERILHQNTFRLHHNIIYLICPLREWWERRWSCC